MTQSKVRRRLQGAGRNCHRRDQTESRNFHNDSSYFLMPSSDKRSQIKINAEKDAIQRVHHAATVTDLEFRVTRRLEGEPCGEAMIAHDVCGAHCLFGGFEHSLMSGAAVPRAG